MSTSPGSSAVGSYESSTTRARPCAFPGQPGMPCEHVTVAGDRGGTSVAARPRRRRGWLAFEHERRLERDQLRVDRLPAHECVCQRTRDPRRAGRARPSAPCRSCSVGRTHRARRSADRARACARRSSCVEPDGVGLRTLATGEEERRGAQRGEELTVGLRVAFEHRRDLGADPFPFLRPRRLVLATALRRRASAASARWPRARARDRFPMSATASPTRSVRGRRTRGGTRRSGP